ncbi:MAG: ROK family protein [Phycisphaerae bacterium]|nr:ROK family protein [Gemmatimonadaceae bacterium]
MSSSPASETQTVLVIDVGGTNVKLRATGQTKSTKVPSGPLLDPETMIGEVKAATADWSFDVIAMGFPSPVVHGNILREPVNLGRGWVGFDFEEAFGKPVRIANDATMQALGSYTDGRMFFMGLGTGMGTALVDYGYAVSLEMGHLPYKERTYEEYLGDKGLKRDGVERWERRVHRIAGELCDAFVCDYVVLGGGNSKVLTSLPPRARLGDNANAFKGGFRMWEKATENER